MKRSLALLVVTLLAALFIWYFEVREESKVLSTDEQEQVSTTLVGVPTGQVQGFTIAKTGGTPIAVEKVQGEWTMTAPVNTSADSSAVNLIISDFEWTPKHATVAAADVTEEKARAFGLDKPAGTVEVKSPAGSRKFIIGGATLEGERIYVREGESGPVHVVDKKFAANLDKTVLEMRNKNVITIEAMQAGYLKLSGPTTATLEKTGSRWDIVEPYREYGDAEAVIRILRAAADMKVVQFVDDEPKDLSVYGLEDPSTTVTVGEGAGGGRSATLVVGSAGPDAEGAVKTVYARLATGRPVFTVKADEVNKLFAGLLDLRSTVVARFDPYALKRVTFTSGTSQVEVVRPGESDWKVVKPFEAPADNDTVSKMIDVFTRARIDQFVTTEPDPVQYGIDNPRGNFEFVEADKAVVAIVFGNDASEGKIYLKRSDTPGLYTVDRKVFDALAEPALSFHSTELRTVNVADAATLTIARADRTYVLKSVPGSYGDASWELVEPVAAPANEVMTATVAAALATTRAETLVERNPADLAKYGLDNPAVKISLSMKTGEPPAPLLIGAAADGGRRYAMLEGGDIVFTLNSAVSKAFLDEARDARVFAFSTAGASGVEFYRGADKYVFDKTGADWSASAPEGVQVDVAALARELTHLTGIETSRFVTFETQQLAQYGLDKPQAVVRVVSGDKVAALCVGNMAPSGHYYATSSLMDGVFLLTPGDVMTVLEPRKVLAASALATPEGVSQGEASQVHELPGLESTE